MPRTTPPRPVDVEALFPEVVPYRRGAVRLHPRAGAPGTRDSSVGGPLLWPAAEPWPHCSDSHPESAFGAPPPDSAVPLVPVLQLFAADVPELPFPPGTDLLQLLWCPYEHEECYAPRPELHWRSSSYDGPVPTDPPRPAGAPDDHLPAPCVLHPERISEYPQWDLPETLEERLRGRFDRLEEETGWSYWDHLSVAPGIKAGGFPNWTQDPDWPGCPECGQRMEHLLTVDSAEFDGASWRGWLPMEDRPDAGTVQDLRYEERRGIQCAPDLMIGDMGGLYVFLCRNCPDLPYTHRSDCS